MRKIIIAAIFCALGSGAMAQKINSGGYVGCVSEDALDEFISAAVNSDTRQMNALLGNTCIEISGLEYSMVDAGIMTSEVRVYVGDQSVLLFTVAEAAR